MYLVLFIYLIIFVYNFVYVIVRLDNNKFVIFSYLFTTYK